MAFQAAAFGKAVLEELGKQRFVFRKGYHAVADIAGRQDVEFAAQASGAAAIVGNGDDGRDFHFPRLQGVPLQPMQERGKPGSPTDGDNAKRRHWVQSGVSIRPTVSSIAGSVRDFNEPAA